MLSTLRKLCSKTGTLSSISSTEQSIFAYAKTAGSELGNVVSPQDLDSLARVVSSINSFHYPPFEPTLREMFAMGGDSAWRSALLEQSKVCKGADALRYLKSLVCCDLPDDILENLLQNVRIESPKDIIDFLSVVRDMDGSKRSKSLFTATNAVVQNAVHANLGLSVYIDIYEMLQKSNLSSRPVVTHKALTELCQAGWKAVLREWKGGESCLVSAIRWLCLGHSDKAAIRGIDKSDLTRFITQLETRVRMTADFASSNAVTVITAILRINKEIVPEPLDSISQLLVLKFPKSLTTTQLVSLVEAVNLYTSSPTRPLQLESLVDSLLPLVVGETRRLISTIPAQHLPPCLQLLGRVDPESVDIELSRRGHELDPVALAKLLIAHPGKPLGLFAAQLQDTVLVNDFVARLTVEERAQLLSLVDSPLVAKALVDSIRAEEKELDFFSTDCLVQMAVYGGDSVFAETNLVPSELVCSRFRSQPETFSNTHANLLLRKGIMREEMIAHVCNSHTMTVHEGIDLLTCAVSPKIIKRIIPTIDAMDATELMNVLALLPATIHKGKSVWSPETQLKRVVLDRFGVLAASNSTLSTDQVVKGFIQLGRLRYYEEEAMGKIVGRLESGQRLTDSASECVAIAAAMAQLGVYSRTLVNQISAEFVPESPEMLAELSSAWVHLGVRSDRIVSAIENVLRTNDVGLSTRIALLHAFASQGIFSALFQEELRRVIQDSQENIGQLADLDWTRLFEINLAIVIDSPPKIKVKYSNNPSYKAFIDDHCAFAWYAKQDAARSKFIHSTERAQLVEAMTSLGWAGSVPEPGKEVYHMDILMSGTGNRGIVFIPESDVLHSSNNKVRIIVGESLAKVKHLQIFGYKIVPLWTSEWNDLETIDERKEYLLHNSLQTVYSLGPADSRTP